MISDFIWWYKKQALQVRIFWSLFDCYLTQSISIEMEVIRPNEKTGIKINRRNDYRGLGRITQST